MPNRPTTSSPTADAPNLGPSVTTAEAPPETTDLLGALDNGPSPAEGDDAPIIEDILAAGDANPATGGMESVRIGSDEVAVIFFTSTSMPVSTHYLEDEEARGYMRCGGKKGCLLCQAGMKPSSHILLPVYVPEASTVQVLMVSAALRAKALLPQVKAVLRSRQPCISFIQKMTSTYFAVTSRPLTASDEDGAAAIKAFLAMKPMPDLRAILNRYDVEVIKAIPRIAAKLKVKGLG